MSTTIALAGNPNCGKTSIFNHLTGSSQYVGNWPGVTVEKKEGKLKGYEEVKLVDTRESVRSFFIRAKAGAEGAVEAAFPGGRELHLADRKEDFGYFTQPMKESEFLAKYEALGEQMLGRIRLV